MNDRTKPRQSNGRIQLVAIVAVTLFVMVLGVLVVVFPRQMGVPQLPATPVASPTATKAP
jgi:hypothetical protein